MNQKTKFGLFFLIASFNFLKDTNSDLFSVSTTIIFPPTISTGLVAATQAKLEHKPYFFEDMPKAKVAIIKAFVPLVVRTTYFFF